jgi:hypothetical protein
VSKKVIKQLKLDNSLVKRQNVEITNDLSFLSQRLYDDLISIKVIPDERARDSSQEGDRNNFPSKVSFNPDIEIASYDPNMPLVKPTHQSKQKPPSGNLVTKKLLNERANEKAANEKIEMDQKHQLILQQVKDLVACHKLQVIQDRPETRQSLTLRLINRRHTEVNETSIQDF